MITNTPPSKGKYYCMGCAIPPFSTAEALADHKAQAYSESAASYVISEGTSHKTRSACDICGRYVHYRLMKRHRAVCAAIAPADLIAVQHGAASQLSAATHVG